MARDTGRGLNRHNAFRGHLLLCPARHRGFVDASLPREVREVHAAPGQNGSKIEHHEEDSCATHNLSQALMLTERDNDSACAAHKN